MVTEEEAPKKPRLREVISSVLAAGFGVQSSRNLERDFRHGSAKQYIVIGLVATIVLVVGLYLAVKVIMGLAGV